LGITIVLATGEIIEYRFDGNTFGVASRVLVAELLTFSGTLKFGGALSVLGWHVGSLFFFS